MLIFFTFEKEVMILYAAQKIKFFIKDIFSKCDQIPSFLLFYQQETYPWFYQDFKSENLCFLNLYSDHAARMLGPVNRDHVKSSQMRNETYLQL